VPQFLIIPAGKYVADVENKNTTPRINMFVML
jgi:hypothetical protein